MFNITFKNDFPNTVAFDGTKVPDGGSHNSGTISGFHSVTGDCISPIAIIDLGDKKLDGYPYPDQTWGVLFKYLNVELYARYEGEGSFDLTLDGYGNIQLSSSNATIIEVDLPTATIGKSEGVKVTEAPSTPPKVEA